MLVMRSNGVDKKKKINGNLCEVDQKKINSNLCEVDQYTKISDFYKYKNGNFDSIKTTIRVP